MITSDELSHVHHSAETSSKLLASQNENRINMSYCFIVFASFISILIQQLLNKSSFFFVFVYKFLLLGNL